MSDPVRSSPPVVRSPKLVQGIQFAVFRRTAMRRWMKRNGRIFEMNVPLFGRSVVVSDPALVKSVCSAGVRPLQNVRPNLGNWFGPGSVFGLDGGRHQTRRRMLARAFHGQDHGCFERLVEDETLREMAEWPEGREFRTLEPMNRITLNVILRAVLGADGAELEQLRALIPRFMRLGQILAFVPTPPLPTGRHGPWGRLAAMRESFDGIVWTLVVRALTDPALDRRTDMLAAFVRAGHSDDTIPGAQICDELITLICAGHETTASALAWTFERLRRHPDVLAALVDEADDGGDELRHATLMETLRARTVIDVFGRRSGMHGADLGGWRIPPERTVLVRIADLHENPDVHPHPERFDPHRFLGARPGAATWLPFGGGSRRCIGAGFATTEMDIVLRTVLRTVRIQTDATPDEGSHFRGIAHTPKEGGRIVVHRRRGPSCPHS